MQRETYYSQLHFRYRRYFNPLPLCRGRLIVILMVLWALNFNPLPLCRGRLVFIKTISGGKSNFNPLPLCRGRPNRKCRRLKTRGFQSSPSMQRETHLPCFLFYPILYFNPLPLCRGRHPHRLPYAHAGVFQSSPSMQRETLF